MFRTLTEERQGEVIIGGGIIIWALFPVLTKVSTNAAPAVLAAGISTFIAAFLFAGVLTIRGQWSELRVREAWIPIAVSILLIGVGYHLLLFWGIQRSTPNTAAIIMLTEALISAVLLRLLGKERLTRSQIIGGFFIILGAAIVLFPGELRFRGGEGALLAAQFFPPLGNYAMQRARILVSSNTILFLRSLASGGFMMILAAIYTPAAFGALTGHDLMILLINGFIALGLCKVLWLEGIHRIPISKAAAMGAAAPLFTMIYSYFFIGEVPTYAQLYGLPFVMIGLFWLTRPAAIVLDEQIPSHPDEDG